jgi:hypothetical protein
MFEKSINGFRVNRRNRDKLKTRINQWQDVRKPLFDKLINAINEKHSEKRIKQLFKWWICLNDNINHHNFMNKFTEARIMPTYEVFLSEAKKRGHVK